MNPDGRGFSVSIDQLLAAKALWVPSVHVYLAAGDSPVAFQDHQKELAASKGKRILESVAREPEAGYTEYTARWEDSGKATFANRASDLACAARWPSSSI